ncbi:hypothetical protein EBT16_15005 [bacterium]|nr:hypothetical protein [bacterium]
MEDPNFRLVPLMNRSYYGVASLQVIEPILGKKALSYTLEDIENTAIQELEQRRAALVAKKVGGIVAKQAAAYGIEKATKSPELGAITALLLHLTDRPDLRTWSFLPAKLQLARMSLPSGDHEIVLERVGPGGQSTQWKRIPKVQIKSGKMTFLNVRVFD